MLLQEVNVESSSMHIALFVSFSEKLDLQVKKIKVGRARLAQNWRLYIEEFISLASSKNWGCQKTGFPPLLPSLEKLTERANLYITAGFGDLLDQVLYFT